MPPFSHPHRLVTAFKERIDAVAVQGDRLYVGTSVGSLHVYGIDSEQGKYQASLVDTHKNLTRKPIEQLAFIKDINSIVCLSDAIVTLFPVPNLSPPTVLSQTKSAFSFGLNSSVQYLLPDGKPQARTDAEFGSNPKALPTLVTHLIVGCRRKVVIYTWKDGEPQEVKEVPLPHSPRTIAFTNANTVCFAYPGPEHALFSLGTLTTTEITTPLPNSSSVMAFSGLTGYMTLGLGAKPKPALCQISDGETLIIKDNEGHPFGPDGKPARPPFVWQSPPEEIAYVKPYIISVLPSSTAASSSNVSSTSSSVHIRSSISPLPTQSISYPFDSATPSSPASTTSIRLLTTSPSNAKSQSFFLVTSPTERVAAAAEGSSIWMFNMTPWLDQMEEMVKAEQYTDALTLLSSLGPEIVPEKEKSLTRLRALDAVSQFKAAKYDDALSKFMDLDINPAKVVALYPDSIAGRLSVTREEWIPLFGGPKPNVVEPSAVVDSPEEAGEPASKDADEAAPSGGEGRLGLAELREGVLPTASSIRGRLRGLGGLIPTTGSRLVDDDAASVHSVSAPAKEEPIDPEVDIRRSVEALLKFLPDRRAKLGGFLDAVHITPEQSHKFPSLSELSVEDLFAIPNASLSSFTPEQLLRCAQVVDTALFKSYLMVRPSLIGALCRRYNWCEVSEIEEELRARQKYLELIDLYNGKRMHIKALNLLRQLSEKESDMRDKLGPSVSYLQKLGPEHLPQIFEASQWVFDQDQDIAFEIFTSEDVELPRGAVADFLQGISLRICARYVEFLIEERNETSSLFHDRLALLYLNITRAAQKSSDIAVQEEYYSKLLQFINESEHYNIDRLYGQISSDDFFEARAILLGRLGRHDQALELYVYRLNDYTKAEDYCKRVYKPDGPTSRVFLTLLRTYLQPTIKTSDNLLAPALDLICRHSPRLDAVETLQLIPPLVTTQEIQAFLKEALRAPLFDSKVIRNISKARGDQTARKLMMLQSRRVVVTDTRICPNCHKRIGNSVIAVHSPRGEVTHYQCREAFAAKLNRR